MTLRELDDYQHDDVAQRTRRKRNFFDPETGDVEKDSPRTLLVEEYVMTRQQNPLGLDAPSTSTVARAVHDDGQTRKKVKFVHKGRNEIS